MSARKLFAIILALGVLFAPSFAYSAAPRPDVQAMEMGHCQMLPSKSADHGKVDGKNCCIAMCMAVAVAPSASLQVAEPRHQVAYFVAPQSWRGFLSEIATPPPRRT
jgi:hypothetical protein